MLEHWNTLGCSNLASEDALSKFVPPCPLMAPASMSPSNIYSKLAGHSTDSSRSIWRFTVTSRLKSQGFCGIWHLSSP